MPNIDFSEQWNCGGKGLCNGPSVLQPVRAIIGSFLIDQPLFPKQRLLLPMTTLIKRLIKKSWG